MVTEIESEEEEGAGIEARREMLMGEGGETALDGECGSVSVVSGEMARGELGETEDSR
jgi:hypothetical protein